MLSDENWHCEVERRFPDHSDNTFSEPVFISRLKRDIFMGSSLENLVLCVCVCLVCVCECVRV